MKESPAETRIIAREITTVGLRFVERYLQTTETARNIMVRATPEGVCLGIGLDDGGNGDCGFNRKDTLTPDEAAHVGKLLIDAAAQARGLKSAG